MKPSLNPYFCLSILLICVFLSLPQLAEAITVEELADTCEKMEKAYKDITVEYEWAVEPAATIEDLKKEGMGGFIIVGSTKCTFSTKLPFEERLLSKESELNMDENEHSFRSTIMKSFDGKTLKELNMGALSSTGEPVDLSIGVITERSIGVLEGLSLLRFTIFNLKYFNIERIFLSELLRKKEFIRLEDSVEKVNDFNAVYIELLWDAPNVPILHKKEPKLRVYFSVDHDYTPIKFDDLSHSESGPQVNLAVNITALEKVSDSLWFPGQGYLKIIDANLSNTYKAAKIVVNQGLTDKDFDIKFPPGTRVTNEITGLRYVQTENEMQSLSGKSLPDLSTFGIELDKKEIENKRILICFFDINQRPSRNCVIQLSERAQELKAKDIEIIAFYASKKEQAILNEWIKENDIDFPVGIIERDEDQTRFNWGVKALPWLILTDKEHIVIDEGFSINDLYEKIME